MNSTEIDALVDHIGGSGDFDLDPSMADSVLRSELEANWDLIPPGTRAVMLATASALRRLFQPTSITGRAIAEAFDEIARALQTRQRGGRKPGAVERTTEHIREVIEDFGGADANPSEVLSHILAIAGAPDSPYELDGAGEGVIYEKGVDGSLTIEQLQTKLYRTKSRYFSSLADRRKRDKVKNNSGDLSSGSR